MIFISLLLLLFYSSQNVAAQNEPNLLAEYKKTDAKLNVKLFDWNGIWSFSSRFQPQSLQIKKLSLHRFKFKLEALNGANSGEIIGVAVTKGNKAFFDDKTNKTRDFDSLGCKIMFVNKGKLIDVKISRECNGYAGNAVTLGGQLSKGKPLPDNTNLNDLKVLPNTKVEKKFRLLTGKDYQTFLDSFHLIYEDDDLDKLNAKVFSACVRGICPYSAGIIMYDAKNNLWAAIINQGNVGKSEIRYYTNNTSWANELPKTIEKWIDDKRSMNDNLTIIYENKK